MQKLLKASSAQNPKTSKAPSFKQGLGENIALQTASSVRNAVFLVCGCLVHSSSFLTVLFDPKVMCVIERLSLVI